MNKTTVRTRFAPSPTGYLHVGGARTALFNYLYARANGGQFVLRIEDTDQARSTEKSYREMVESIQWLGLHWDEGPEKGGPYGSYKQSERLDTYREHAAKLIEEKKAYYCFCSTDELEVKKKKREAMGLPYVYDGKCRSLSDEEVKEKLHAGAPHTIRFQMTTEEVVVEDVVQGNVHFDASLIGDFIIVKSDGFPSYNYAVVVDDTLMKITHIIRGVGHLSNTPRQIAIYRAFGWPEPVWAHVSEISGSDHKKLSKRHGAAAITVFRDLGYPAEAFLNYMSLLGWSPPDGNEFMTPEAIASQFDIKRCSKSPAMFDIFDMKLADGIELNELGPDQLEQYLFQKSKLNHLGNRHIRAVKEDEYLSAIRPFVKASGKVPENELSTDNEKLRSILLSLRVYLDYYHQITHYIGDFFGNFDISDTASDWMDQQPTAEIVQTFREQLEACASFDETQIKEAITKTGQERDVKGKNLFMTIRAAATGKTEGLELPVYLNLLGKEQVFNRLEYTLQWLKDRPTP